VENEKGERTVGVQIRGKKRGSGGERRFAQKAIKSEGFYGIRGMKDRPQRSHGTFFFCGKGK